MSGKAIAFIIFILAMVCGYIWCLILDRREKMEQIAYKKQKEKEHNEYLREKSYIQWAKKFPCDYSLNEVRICPKYIPERMYHGMEVGLEIGGIKVQHCNLNNLYFMEDWKMDINDRQGSYWYKQYIIFIPDESLEEGMSVTKCIDMYYEPILPKQITIEWK